MIGRQEYAGQLGRGINKLRYVSWRYENTYLSLIFFEKPGSTWIRDICNQEYISKLYSICFCSIFSVSQY